MSQPGNPEGLVEPDFKTRFDYQQEESKKFFGLYSDARRKLYSLQPETLNSAVKTIYAEHLVEKALFKFVAPVNGKLESFGVVINPFVRSLDKLNSQKALLMSFEVFIIASNPQFNEGDELDGDRKIILKPQVFEEVRNEVLKKGINKRLQSLLYPNGLRDRIKNFLH